MEHQLAVTDRFDPYVMQAFMRQPDIYWAGADALAPQPEQRDFVSYLQHSDVWTLGAFHAGFVFGFVTFNQRTSVGAEIHVGFHPQYRGYIAGKVVQFALDQAFNQKGLLKVWAPIPADNRAAIMGARRLGFHVEGRLTNAIVRHNVLLTDLVILSTERKGVH